MYIFLNAAFTLKFILNILMILINKKCNVDQQGFKNKVLLVSSNTLTACSYS